MKNFQKAEDGGARAPAAMKKPAWIGENPKINDEFLHMVMDPYTNIKFLAAFIIVFFIFLGIYFLM